MRAVHPESGAVIERTVTQADLGWQAIDLLMHLDVEADQLMSTLDDGVVDHVVASLGLRPDAQLSIDHTAVVDGHATFFQMAPVVRNLRSLLLKPSVLRPTDLMAPGEVASAEPVPSLERSRVAGPLAELSELRALVVAALAAIDADLPAAIDDIDGTVASVLALSGAATRFGIGAGGSGQLRAAYGQVFGEIVAIVATIASGIVERFARFDLGLAAFDALPVSTSAATRLDRLVELERLVSTVATSPLPAVAAMRATVVVKRGVLSARRGSIAAAATGHTALRPFLTSVIGAVVDAAPTLAELVGATPDLTAREQAISALADTARRQLVAMLDDVDQRMIKAAAALSDFDSTADPTAQVDALTTGGRALFGESFPIVPTLTLPPDRSAALGAALASSGDLTAPLVAAGRDDPVGDWFHGVARVRERVQSWETVVMLIDPLRRRSDSAPVSETDLGLAAIQFPHIAGAPWMALELLPGTVPSADTLCYTVVGTITDATRVSGIVIDDWPEVISLPERTAGLAVHFDGPNSEPPQAWLVVTPATWDGSWQWDDLVTALGDTLDLARLRAVEPDHIDDSRYAPLLPATVLPVAPFQISIVANLAMNLERCSKFRED